MIDYRPMTTGFGDPCRGAPIQRDMLYLREARAFAAALLPDQHAARVESLGNGVAGVMRAGKAAIHAIGAAYASLKGIKTKSGIKQMGGLGSMAKAYGSKWIWSRFWEMTAFLSMALAFLNILPIPALDGGHVVFLLYEAVARRPANPKVLEYAQMAGMVFLLTVIIAVNGHDIFKIFTGQL